MRKRCVLGAVLSVVVLGGCGGGGLVGPRLAAPSGRSAPGTPQTGRFAAVFATNDAEPDVLLSASGTFDHVRRRYTFEVGGRLAASPVVPRRLIAVGGDVYADFPALARRMGVSTTWIHEDSDDDWASWLHRFDPEPMLAMAASTDATVERDGDGLVRRIVMRFDAPGQGGSVLLTVTYADLGAPVRIEPPPADEVTDVGEAARRRTGRPTGG